MTPTDLGRIFVVRVDADDAIVAELDVEVPRTRRALRFPGGLDAVDRLIEALVLQAVPDSEAPAEIPGGDHDQERIRRDIAAARARLMVDESTTVAVRRSGRTTFVPLSRDAVVAELAPGNARVARGLTRLGARADSPIVVLPGGGEVPGLRDHLPGRLLDPLDVPAEPGGLDAALDAAYGNPSVDAASSPVGPRDETVPDATPVAGTARARGTIILRRAWPGAVAVLVLLAVSGTAAAMDLGGSPAAGHPSTASPQPHTTTARRSATPSSTTPVTPTAAPIVSPPSMPSPAARTGPRGNAPGAAPGPGSAPVVVPATPPDPAVPATSPPTPEPSTTPAPDPSPTDTLGGILDPVGP